MLEARRAAEETVSRGPKLAVNVSSHVASQSLAELSLGDFTRTRVREDAGKPPEGR
jgi:hypothetical protein